MPAKACDDCVHIRHGRAPDPLAGIRLVSKKILELRARWQQELATRATFEEQRLVGGHAFDFEPIAYPYCARFSTPEPGQQEPARRFTVFEPCARANPRGECAAFQARAPR
jgi:hypothetical protein